MKYKVSSISTLKKGTVVVMEKKIKAVGSYPSGVKIKAFFDKNNNGRLDRGDVVLKTAYGTRRCPLRARYVRSMDHFGYCRRSVTTVDIVMYGKRVGKLFKQAKRERRKFRKSIKPQSVGTCVIGGRDIARKFNPPLSLLTKRVVKGKRYTKAQVMSLQNINPSRCNAAYSTFAMRVGRSTVNIRFDMNNGAGPVFNRLLESFGFFNSAAHVDISFMRGVVDVYHIDLNK